MIGNKSGLEGPPFGISINFIILILSNGTTIERGFCLKSPQLKNDLLKVDFIEKVANVVGGRDINLAGSK